MGNSLLNKRIRYQVVVLLFVIMQTACAQQARQIAGAGLWTVDISHDDKYIATGGDDSVLKIYTGDFKLYKAIKFEKQGMIRAVHWHPKENLLAIATRNSIWIMDAETGKEIHLEGKHNGSRTIAWNHNGEMLAAAAGSGVVWIWNRDGKLLRSIQKQTDGKNDNKDFLGLDWHPSKNILVTAGDEIRIFDTSGVQLNSFRHRGKQAGILTVSWHPSGEFFVTGDYGHPEEGIPTLLQFWKEDGALIKEWNESKKEFRNIRWNRQGTLLATGSDALRIWSKQGELIHTAESDGSVLWGVDWTSNSDKIVTVSFATGELKEWNNKAQLSKIHR